MRGTISVFCSGPAVIQPPIRSFSILLCSHKQHSILHAMLNRDPQMTQVMNLENVKTKKDPHRGNNIHTDSLYIRNRSQPGQLTIIKGKFIKMKEGYGDR